MGTKGGRRLLAAAEKQAAARAASESSSSSQSDSSTTDVSTSTANVSLESSSSQLDASATLTQPTQPPVAPLTWTQRATQALPGTLQALVPSLVSWCSRQDVLLMLAAVLVAYGLGRFECSSLWLVFVVAAFVTPLTGFEERAARAAVRHERRAVQQQVLEAAERQRQLLELYGPTPKRRASNAPPSPATPLSAASMAEPTASRSASAAVEPAEAPVLAVTGAEAHVASSVADPAPPPDSGTAAAAALWASATLGDSSSPTTPSNLETSSSSLPSASPATRKRSLPFAVPSLKLPHSSDELESSSSSVASSADDLVLPRDTLTPSRSPRRDSEAAATTPSRSPRRDTASGGTPMRTRSQEPQTPGPSQFDSLAPPQIFTESAEFLNSLLHVLFTHHAGFLTELFLTYGNPLVLKIAKHAALDLRFVNLDLANNAPRLSKIKGWIEDSNCAAWIVEGEMELSTGAEARGLILVRVGVQVPVTVSNIHIWAKFRLRLVMSNPPAQFPFIQLANVQLLAPPIIDLSIEPFHVADMLDLPFVSTIIKSFLGMVREFAYQVLNAAGPGLDLDIGAALESALTDPPSTVLGQQVAAAGAALRELSHKFAESSTQRQWTKSHPLNEVSATGVSLFKKGVQALEIGVGVGTASANLLSRGIRAGITHTNTIKNTGTRMLERQEAALGETLSDASRRVTGHVTNVLLKPSSSSAKRKARSLSSNAGNSNGSPRRGSAANTPQQHDGDDEPDSSPIVALDLASGPPTPQFDMDLAYSDPVLSEDDRRLLEALSLLESTATATTATATDEPVSKRKRRSWQVFRS